MKKINTLILIFIFGSLGISKTIEQKKFLEISFDKIFPESQIEQFQKKIINLSYLIGDIEENKLQSIEKKLLDNLIDIYAMYYLFRYEIKRNKKIQKNDLEFWIKLINYNKKVFNTKFTSSNSIIEYINFIFDKLLVNIDQTIF